MAHEPHQPKVSFEEFKLYYKSAEKVTDRRLETNRWNHSICVATLVAVALLTRWGLGAPGFLWVSLLTADVLSLMGAIFSVLWVNQIEDFKTLNDVKFSVLAEMAPKLEFDLEKPGQVASHDPFAKEWQRLKDRNAVRPVRGGKLVALKGTTAEYFVPQAFATLFAVFVLSLTLAIVLGWSPIATAQGSGHSNPAVTNGSRVN